MGREIRKVIPNWEHPKKEKYNYIKQRLEKVYQPMYDRPYIEAINEWIEEHQKWEQGNHPKQDKDYRYYAEFAGNAPDFEYYRPDWNEQEMTWFQVYETVSEGTPVTPPFETQQELIEYLVKNGDFWNQQRRESCDPWTREQAEKFVFGDRWIPSGIIKNNKFYVGKEIMDLK